MKKNNLRILHLLLMWIFKNHDDLNLKAKDLIFI